MPQKTEIKYKLIGIIRWQLPLYLKAKCRINKTEKKEFMQNQKENEKLTVSGPVTLVGGGIERNVFRSSGPGLLRDKRLRTWDAAPILLNGFAAKSKPYTQNNFNIKHLLLVS